MRTLVPESRRVLRVPLVPGVPCLNATWILFLNEHAKLRWVLRFGVAIGEWLRNSPGNRLDRLNVHVAPA